MSLRSILLIGLRFWLKIKELKEILRKASDYSKPNQQTYKETSTFDNVDWDQHKLKDLITLQL